MFSCCPLFPVFSAPSWSRQTAALPGSGSDGPNFPLGLNKVVYLSIYLSIYGGFFLLKGSFFSHSRLVHAQDGGLDQREVSEQPVGFLKAAVRNFYVSINIRFTQAAIRGDDTTLIKPFGSSNTSRNFPFFFSFCVWCRRATFPRWRTGNDAFYSVLPERGGGALLEATWRRTRRRDQEVQKWIALKRKGLSVQQKVCLRRERVTKGEN